MVIDASLGYFNKDSNMSAETCLLRNEKYKYLIKLLILATASTLHQYYLIKNRSDAKYLKGTISYFQNADATILNFQLKNI